MIPVTATTDGDTDRYRTDHTMSNATITPAAVETIPAPKAAPKAKVPTPAAKALQDRKAAEAAARDLTPAQLVARIQSERGTEEKTLEQVEHFRNMFEAAKLAKSNQRVILARTAYLLASHPEVAGKAKAARGATNTMGAAKLLTEPGDMADPDYKRTVNRLRVWLTTHVLAGEALHAKKLAFNTADPTEAERAIVEKSHDETIRAASAKGNAKVKAKVAAAEKGEETDGGGVVKAKVETVIPTAGGILSALETVLKNVQRFKSDAAFSEDEAEELHAALLAISTELDAEQDFADADES